MREGMAEENNKAEQIRKDRERDEVIDEEEAPQVVIDKRWKGRIDEKQARDYVAEQEGVKIERSKDEKSSEQEKEKDETKVIPVTIPKVDNVSLGMKKAKKKEGIKRAADDEKEAKAKSRKGDGRKEKKMKLSFEDE
jgi:hypothetical protein